MGATILRPSDWWSRRSVWPTLPVAELAARKAGLRVAVLVPARDEQATVEGVVRPLLEELVPAGLVDQVVVVDGRSQDATAQVARAAGAEVLVVPTHHAGRALEGKGGALWWAQQQVDADVLVFLDADVTPSRSATAAALLTPLLLEPDVQFVKAAFDRPLTVDGVLHHGSGGRVTELLARPVLDAWWPELAGFVQPLAGEIAVRRDLLAQLPFSVGYALEVGMLVDVLELVGLDAMAQADIGERRHRHQSDEALGRMAAAVFAAAAARHAAGPLADRLVQYRRTGQGFEAHESQVSLAALPPVLLERAS